MASKKPSRRMTEHGFTAILERMELQNRATLEAVTGQISRLDRRMEDLGRDLGAKISALEISVRMNSEDIRKNSEDIRQNSAEIQRMKEQLSELTDAVRGKVDARELAALEARVAKLEARLGL